MNEENGECHTSAEAPTWKLADLTISGGSFRVCVHLRASGCSAYDRNGYSGEYTDQDGCEFSAGIQLPHGATVFAVFVFYDGNGTSAELHFEESGPFGGHTDIAALDLNDCGSDECVAFEAGGDLESPDINNLFFGYAAWVSPSCRRRSCSDAEQHPQGRQGGQPEEGPLSSRRKGGARRGPALAVSYGSRGYGVSWLLPVRSSEQRARSRPPLVRR